MVAMLLCRQISHPEIGANFLVMTRAVRRITILAGDSMDRKVATDAIIHTAT